MGNEARKHRREVFSYPKAQLRIMLSFAVLSLVYILVGNYVALNAFCGFGRDLGEVGLTEDVRYDLEVIYASWQTILLMQLSVFTFMAIVMVGLGAILMSHRIAGPLTQLKKYLAQLAAGQCAPRRIRFRKYDFFHEVAAEFNRLQESKGWIPPEPPAGGGAEATDRA